MTHLRWLDVFIVGAYILGLTAIGLRFSRKQTTTEHYFMAKRSIPSWAMGMSFMATLVTSLTFVSYPGAAYGKDWSLLVPGLLVIGVLGLVGTIIIPFYRQAVGMSAYEYFGKRFGLPTRVYSSIAFALAHFSKMGFVFYLLALTINSMTGWNMDQVIIGAGLLTIFYTLKGGLEAVVWTDVLQGFVLWAGVFVCLAYLLFLPPGGPSAVLALAAANHKFSLGEWSFDFSKPTIPVLLIYGFFWYLQKYTADQTIVQRYLIAKSDRGALRGVGLGAFLCVPAWALFMMIGTCTWTFYRLTGEKLPAYITKADQVFPHFLSTHLPVGMAGLILASLVGGRCARWPAI
jgi:SSS family solute:Na+ symporter